MIPAGIWKWPSLVYQKQDKEFFKLAQVTESLPINQIKFFKKTYAGSMLHFFLLCSKIILEMNT